MARRRKKVLCYWLEWKREGNYTMLYLSITEGTERSIPELLEGTVDNKAGYGTPDAADRMHDWYTRLLEAGHQILIDPMGWEGSFPRIIIRYQEYQPYHTGDQPGYCQPSFTLGTGGFSDIERGAKFLRRLGRAIEKASAERRGDSHAQIQARDSSFKDPVAVIEGLHRLKARYVDLIRGTGVHQYQLARVYSGSPRPWLLTDSLWRTFEVQL